MDVIIKYKGNLSGTKKMNNSKTSRRYFNKAAITITGSALINKIKTTQASNYNIIKRPIPSSGELIPVIGLGTSSSFIIKNSDSTSYKKRTDVIRTLLDFGGTIIDTAPSYRGSQAIVGNILQQINTNTAPFIATKVRQENEEEGIRELENSFKELNTDTIDLIQVHNLVDTNRKLSLLKEWQKDKRYRYIGITHWRPGIQDDLVPVMKNNSIDFVQFQYNIEERGAEKSILQTAQDRGIATMVNVPFGRGKLFKQTRNKSIPEWAKNFSSSWAQFYLKFILSNPNVTCVIPATSNVDHMKDNLEAGSGRLPDKKERKMMVNYIENL